MRENGFAPLLFIVLFAIISGGIIGGSLYIKNNTSFLKKTTPNFATNSIPTVSPKAKDTPIPSTSPITKATSPISNLVGKMLFEKGIYRRDDRGYSFQIPEGFIAEENFSVKYKQPWIVYLQTKQNGREITISILDLKDLTVDADLLKKIHSNSSVSTNNLVIDGHKGIQVSEFRASPTLPDLITYIENGHLTVEISMQDQTPNKSEYDVDAQNYKKILDSFKFDSVDQEKILSSQCLFFLDPTKGYSPQRICP